MSKGKIKMKKIEERNEKKILRSREGGKNAIRKEREGSV